MNQNISPDSERLPCLTESGLPVPWCSLIRAVTAFRRGVGTGFAYGDRHRVRLNRVYSKLNLTAVNFGAASGFKAQRHHRRDLLSDSDELEDKFENKYRDEWRQEFQQIHKDWFTDPALNDGVWSTDWDDFELIKFWIRRTPDGKLKIDKLLKEIWVVPGTIEMLAYMPYCPGSYFWFAAGGEYYFWADYVLKKHSKKFASHQEFVDYALKPVDLRIRTSRLPEVAVPQAVESDFLWFSRGTVVYRKALGWKRLEGKSTMHEQDFAEIQDVVCRQESHSEKGQTTRNRNGYELTRTEGESGPGK
ncbi:hypothetical protein FB45DRAFT_876962 [Roridomyces roridus]|uniref:Uncharacterized protein n=1 Tax=Roridomyces roridus TaxID=1738132 RepID=A0AAD7B2C1_9AGAR|nr:hypothetical protein FB45DRAFT_876962 [Roridomyces roridus]